jgi:dephospho-CoA kinase
VRPRLRIGLTGGIASGKSTVVERFRELGVPVVDADEAARRVVAPATSGLASVVDRFGPGVLDAHGHLDRSALRSLVFSDPAKRRELESILHPLIRADMDRAAAQATGPYLIYAIPLLVESGRRGDFDRILVIDTDEARQLERLMARDGSSATQARAILAAQTSRARRLEAAHDVLTNSDTIESLRREVDRLHRRYLELSGQRAT